MVRSAPLSLRDYRPVRLGGLIRVGRDNDGGYVLPRDVIDKSHALLSLGVNDDWSFEEGVLAHNPSMSITCVDGTTGMGRILRKVAQRSVDMLGHLLTFQFGKFLRNARYLAKPWQFHRFFSRHELLPLMVAAKDAPGAVTLPSLLRRVTGARDDRWVMLKCDVEGAEFEVLPASLGEMHRVAALLIEFHRLDLHAEQFKSCMAELMRLFYIAHLHGNNFDGYVGDTGVPITLEVTLVNKALVKGVPPFMQCAYPIAGLDMCNRRKHPDLQLVFEAD
jgi:hypothetical protein